MTNYLESLEGSGLYQPKFEHDNCGFGLIAQMDGRPSHWLVKTAITALGRMTHRGAIGADGKTGDGCGLLLRKPESFLRSVAAEANMNLTGEFATGLVFMSHDDAIADKAKKTLETELTRRGLEFKFHASSSCSSQRPKTWTPLNLIGTCMLHVAALNSR